MLEQVMADNGFPVPLVEGGNCRVFQFHSGTGEGIMTQYDLFPGVSLMYNDFHMESYDSAFRTTEDLLCIDYCRQGRMEYPAGPDAYSYVEAGDLKLDRRLEHQGHFTFPLAHYHGITVGFALPQAAQSLKEWIREFPVDLARLQNKFCSSRHPKVLHGAPSIDHIFQELYAVPEQIKIPYFRIKVLELLLYLDALELPKDCLLYTSMFLLMVTRIYGPILAILANLSSLLNLNVVTSRMRTLLTTCPTPQHSKW